jgi:predicted GIY-YIG superfamily endonuclease
MIIAMKEWKPAIYIMTNKRNGTLYTGVTNNLLTRLYQHKQGVQPGFTKQYGCTQLVYYELYADMLSVNCSRKTNQSRFEKEKISPNRRHKSKMVRSV